ncbi:MAG: type 4a pilus biogenesis protein PilO [Deltaproteobacteria bacterium]|nr:type 4a pilus biogenesis protein PilO [Deltaproteobacteria bacterium]
MKKKIEAPPPSTDGALDKIVNRVSQFTKVQRILICVAMFLAVTALFANFSFKPKYEDYTRLNTELAELETKLNEYQKVATLLEEVRKKKEEAEVKYKKGLRLLPDQEEIPELLDGVAKIGKDVNVGITSFRPGEKTTGAELYAIKPLNIEIAGSYHNIALFFDRLAKLFRIVTLLEFKLEPAKRSTQVGADSDLLAATMKANAYVFVENKPSEPKEGGQAAGTDQGKEAATKADENAKPK